MILDPINDADCLGQLTRIARELAPTTLVQSVARRLGSRAAVVRWFQSLPQADDDGGESVRFIQCDVPQRVRLLPDDPNCVERSTNALMLLEVIDPSTPRALATVDRPLRHTGIVEKTGVHWRAIDLFPRRNGRRNFNFGEFAKDALQGVHQYAGKPLLKFYFGDTGGTIADTIGEHEDRLIGREKKKQPPKPQKPNEKKPEPPPPAKRAEPTPIAAQPRPAPRPAAQARIVGAGANATRPTPDRGGGRDDEEEKGKDDVHAGASARPRAPVAGASPPREEEAQGAKRWWWFLG